MSSKHFKQRIVTLGGGTGHFSLLRGLVELNEPELITAITGTWDSGGSSGRLRVEMGVLPSGDTRQCLLALMEDDNQRQVAQRLFNERFSDLEGPLKGHALGNLIQSQLQRIYQGQDRGIDATRALFRIRSQVVPVSLTDLQLCAETRFGNIIEGEDKIDTRGEKDGYNHQNFVSRIYFDTTADPNPKALESITQADKIVISPGDLYTSILPHLLVSGITEAIISSDAKLIFCLNLMTKKGETDSFNASDFIEAFLHYLGAPDRLNVIITNQNHIDEKVIRLYKDEGKEPVEADEKKCFLIAPQAKIIDLPLAKYSPTSHLLRHDPIKLAQAVLKI